MVVAWIEHMNNFSEFSIFRIHLLRPFNMEMSIGLLVLLHRFDLNIHVDWFLRCHTNKNSNKLFFPHRSTNLTMFWLEQHSIDWATIANKRNKCGSSWVISIYVYTQISICNWARPPDQKSYWEKGTKYSRFCSRHKRLPSSVSHAQHPTWTTIVCIVLNGLDWSRKSQKPNRCRHRMNLRRILA